MRKKYLFLLLTTILTITGLKINTGITKQTLLKSPDKKQNVRFFHHRHYIEPIEKELEEHNKIIELAKTLSSNKNNLTVLIETYPEDTMVKKLLDLSKIIKKIDKKLYALLGIDIKKDIRKDVLKYLKYYDPYYNDSMHQLYKKIKDIKNIETHAIDARGEPFLHFRMCELQIKIYMLNFLSKSEHKDFMDKNKLNIEKLDTFTWKKYFDFLKKEKENIKKIAHKRHSVYFNDYFTHLIENKLLSLINETDRDKSSSKLIQSIISPFEKTMGKEATFIFLTRFILYNRNKISWDSINKSLKTKFENFDTLEKKIPGKDYIPQKDKKLRILFSYFKLLGEDNENSIFHALTKLVDIKILAYINSKKPTENIFIWSGGNHCEKCTDTLTKYFKYKITEEEEKKP